MQSVFKKLPDLSYRSHKLQSGTAGDTTRNLESFDIRPPYLDRGFMDPSKWLTTTTSSGYSTTTTISTGNNNNKNNHNTHGSSHRTAMPTSSELTVTGVTGIPNLVELDDAFNTLDPGQLLRESAAAATRAALLSEPLRAATAVPADAIRASTERRRKSSHLVDDLLQQIYHPQTSFDDDDETFAGESTDDLPGGHFSPKCVHPLKRKGNSKPIRLDSLVTHPSAA